MPKAENIAFVSTRFPEGPMAGGAEVLLKKLAARIASKGRKLTFLTTCAKNHFTWANEMPPGRKNIDGIEVIFFPVDQNRNLKIFYQVQDTISRGCSVSREQEELWLRNNINSKELYDYLRENGSKYDRIVAGPYLFGLIYFASLIHPEKTLLVPCLHDEPFAYLSCFQELFGKIRGIMFNSEPEMNLARRLFNLNPSDKKLEISVVGMGIDPFPCDRAAFVSKYKITTPYVMYSGRRELLKGIPALIDYITAFRARNRRDIKLVLTGVGPVQLAPEAKPYVLDLGLVSEEDMHNAMSGALAFCHPSTYESFGIVILESWLAGTPALVHAKSEVLKYQCRKSNGGLWFRSYPEFEEELMLLMDNPDLREKLAQAGKNYVLKEYSWDTIDTKLFKALDGAN